MSNHCPECDRRIVNRKIAQCSWCGSKLPKELLFTEEEIAEIESQRAKERASHDKHMDKMGENKGPRGGIGDAGSI